MKKMKKILSAVLTVVMVMTMVSGVVFGMSVGEYTFDPHRVDDDGANNIVNVVLGFIQFAAFAVAIGMMIFIGIKYMLAGAGQKAEVKTTLLPYVIGAVLVGGAAAIANFLVSLGQQA